LVLRGTAFWRTPAETAAYFLDSVSLANVAKHAHASHMRVGVGVEGLGGRALVDVEDDGIGGADPAHGSGLRGLADPVDAGSRSAVTAAAACRGGAGVPPCPPFCARGKLVVGGEVLLAG
jgi:hypothetical protein